jgi:hypothetical protein
MAALFYLPKGVDIVAYDVGVKDYMTQNGYNPDKISYDSGSGYVQYNGSNFLRPQKNYNGTTFSDQDTLNQANQAFRQNNSHLFDAQDNPNAIFTASSQSSSPNYSNYANNSNYGQTQQTGQGQINDTLNYLRNYSQNQQPFDVYSSPQYQSALSNANYLTQQNIRGAQEALGTAGLGRSSALQDEAQRLGNIQQQNLMTQVVPQIIQQHQAQQQQQYQNALSSLNALMQNNQNQFNQGIQQAGLTGQYNGQQTLAGQNQEFNQGIQQANLTGVYNPYAKQEQQMQANSAAWFNASPEEQARLAAANQQIGALIGAKQDAQGNWIYPQGQQTLAGQQQEANLTGMYNGNPTYQAQQQAIQNAINRAGAFGQVTNPEDAQILGVPLGTTTRELQALLYKNQYQNAMLGLKQQANQIAATRAGNQATRDQAMSNYYNARSSDVKNTQDANNITSEVYNHAQDFQSPQDVEDYFKANGSYLAQHLGAKATNDLKNSFLAPFQQDNKQSSSIYDRAFAAAQRDGDWPSLSSDEKNARISQYQQMLQNQGAGNQ